MGTGYTGPGLAHWPERGDWGLDRNEEQGRKAPRGPREQGAMAQWRAGNEPCFCWGTAWPKIPRGERLWCVPGTERTKATQTFHWRTL